MDRFNPKLDLSVDEHTGGIRAAYLRVRNGTVHETREVAEGRAFADYDAQGLLLGIELLGPCTAEEWDLLSAAEPEPVRRFLRGSPPRDLMLIASPAS
ncbi:MAG: DUF2283 domain-containing protein [Planctomycetia bacterium]|nr:DUF2283 domain-containing protein [Planctomycetia bacterium]